MARKRRGLTKAGRAQAQCPQLATLGRQQTLYTLPHLFGHILHAQVFQCRQRLSSIGLIFLVTWLLWVVLDTAIQEALKPPVSKRSSRQPSTRVKTILPLLRNAIKIILVVICAITTMANLGINVAPLLAGAGVVGLAIGFGSQQLVQDVITGLFIIIEDTLSIGDWVVLDSGHAGTVEGLTIRTLRLRDGKGFVHSVPFGQIKAVTNQSRQFAYAFFSVQFSYQTDVDSALQLIREVGQSISEDPILRHSLQGLGAPSGQRHVPAVPEQGQRGRPERAQGAAAAGVHEAQAVGLEMRETPGAEHAGRDFRKGDHAAAAKKRTSIAS